MDDVTVVRLLDEKLQNYPTKQDLADAIAAAIAPLATRQELAELKRYVGVGFESLRDEIRVVADGVIHLNDRMDRFLTENERRFGTHDVRLDRLDIRSTRLEEHTGLDTRER